MRGRQLLRRSLLVGAFGLLLVGARDTGVLYGQSPAFEAASIKPNNSGIQLENFDALPGGRLVATNVTVGDMVRVAYGTPSRALAPEQLANSPGWVTSERFDVVGKAAGDASRGELWMMLRTLLAERFRLKVRTETREMPIYMLVLARTDGRLGPNLRRANADCPTVPGAASNDAVPPCQMRMSTGKRSGRAVTMAELARSLAGGVGGRDVRDQTGLVGRFDFDVVWTPEAALLGAEPPSDSTSVFTAVEEQLGLKLKATTGPVEVVVIERVAHPTPD